MFTSDRREVTNYLERRKSSILQKVSLQKVLQKVSATNSIDHKSAVARQARGPRAAARQARGSSAATRQARGLKNGEKRKLIPFVAIPFEVQSKKLSMLRPLPILNACVTNTVPDFP